jgi:hypothetical protein
MKPDVNDVSSDVADALEQLRAEPEQSIETTAEDLGARIADRLDAEDEQRAVPPVGETINAQAGQRRDGRGRFASVSPSDAETPADVAASPASAGGPPTAPTSWSAAAKREFDRLSPTVRDAISKRETEMASGIQKYSEKSRAWDSVDQIMAPRRPYLQQFGFRSDQQAIEHMLLWSDALARNPTQAIADLASHLRVNIGQQQAQPAMSPREVADMEAARAQVAAFEARPPAHYEVARPIMRQFLERGQAVDMKDAYDRAMALVRSVSGGRESVERKIRASGASLTGAPHGVGQSSSPKRSSGPAPHFVDVADDVRAALAALS